MRNKTLFSYVAVFLFLCVSRVSAASIVEDWSLAPSAYDVHAVSVDRVSTFSDPDGKSRRIARFTVRPGDVFQGSSGERAEIVLDGWRSTSRFRVHGDEGVEYYRISVKLDADWLSPEKDSRGQLWGTFFQLHGPNEYGSPPAVAFLADDSFALFVYGGNVNQKLGGRRVLTNSELKRGTWVDFVLAVKWAIDESGSVTLFRRDEGQESWEKVLDIKSVATLQYKGDPVIKYHYWKAGFYRSSSSHENGLMLGPIIRARTFGEVSK